MIIDFDGSPKIFTADRSGRVGSKRSGDQASAPGLSPSRHKRAVAVHQLAVRADLRIMVQVADHVPMDDRFIAPAGFGVAGPHRHVECAADFLVKQDVARKAVNLVVGADGEFAHEARPGVAVQHLNQVLFVFFGVR